MIEEGSLIGHVRIECLLGEGGMGKVFRGFDEKLERLVAVKALTAERRLKPEAKARFLREARLLSRLDDPRICRIYDLVEDDDTDLLILEYIEGVTLSEAIKEELHSDDTLRLFLGVAQALAAAHREGIVHRDLKPDNVMVSKDNQVKVLDFGIARSVAARVVATPDPPQPASTPSGPAMVNGLEPGLGPTKTLSATGADTGSVGTDGLVKPVQTLATRAGSLLGTVRYMSPEQAAGLAVTAASDLYSLGIMMQELLTGRGAYGEASGMELLLKVYRAKTVPVTGIDPEVATLIKDLSQIEPEARPDAEATAARLRSILARPLRRRRRRLRLLAATVLAGVVLAASAVSIHARLEAGKQAMLAQSFAAQAEEIVWRLRVEHLSPEHDIQPALAEMRGRVEEVRRRMTELGAGARGPGHAALGRAHLALGELDQARAHLETARAAGFQSPETDFALGIVLGRIYSRELSQARGISDPKAKAGAIERIRAELRDPAVRLLVESRDATGVTPRYVEGLIARYEERYEDGLAAAEAVAETVPWFYEALQLVGELHLELSARAADADRDVVSQAEELGLAVDAIERALAVGRSDPDLHAALCGYRMREVGSQVFGSDPMLPLERVEAAFAPCQAALAIYADTRGVEATRSYLFTLLAIAQERHGLDPNPSYRQASTTAARAVELEPNSRAAHASQGWADTWFAYHLYRTDGDPRPAATRAIAAYQRVLELLPDDLTILVHSGNCYWLTSSYELDHGLDPRPTIEQGLAAMRRGLDAHPEHATMMGVTGSLLRNRGTYERLHGLSGEASLTEAIGAFYAAGEKAANPDVLNALAFAQVELAIVRLGQGRDPGPDLNAAEETANRSLTLFPGFAEPHYYLGYASLVRAWHARLTGAPLAALVEQAVSHMRAGLEVSSHDPASGYEGIAAAYLVEARARLEAGSSPRRAVEAARAAVDAVLEIDPERPETLVTLIELETIEARWRMSRGGSPLAWFERAVTAIRRAHEANPNHAEGRRAAAEAHLWQARWLMSQGESAAADLDQALKEITRALEINMRLGRAELVRGEIELERSLILDDQREASNAKAAAEQAFQRALELNPYLEPWVTEASVVPTR